MDDNVLDGDDSEAATPDPDETNFGVECAIEGNGRNGRDAGKEFRFC